MREGLSDEGLIELRRGESEGRSSRRDRMRDLRDVDFIEEDRELREARRRELDALSPTELYDLQNGMDMKGRRDQEYFLMNGKQKRWNRLAFRYDSRRDYESWSELDVGLMNVECTECGALKYPKERKTLCCNNGKVNIPSFKPPPEDIRVLMDGDFAIGHFHDNIVRYNTLFNFLSTRSFLSYSQANMSC